MVRQDLRGRPDVRFLSATVTARQEISADLWTMRIVPDGEFSFRAGQYATLGINTADRLVERAYSIVSSPHESELEFFLELVPAGELTPLLHRLEVGDTLSLRRAAKGRFLLEAAQPDTDHLFLGTVTGVAPFLSLIRTWQRDWAAGSLAEDRHLYLLQGASRASEFGYREEIERVAREMPWLTYVPTLSRPWEEPAWSGEIGRVDDLIRKYSDQWVPNPARAVAHLCGHPSMIEHGKAILTRRGWHKERLKEESYFALKA